MLAVGRGGTRPRKYDSPWLLRQASCVAPPFQLFGAHLQRAEVTCRTESSARTRSSPALRDCALPESLSHKSTNLSIFLCKVCEASREFRTGVRRREKNKSREKSTAGPKTRTLPKNQNRERCGTRNHKPSASAAPPALPPALFQWRASESVNWTTMDLPGVEPLQQPAASRCGMPGSRS